MDHLAGFQSLRATMERCSAIVSIAYDKKPEELYRFEGELPPGHNMGHRRHRYWVTEVGGDMVVALPGTTHPLDWSSNMRVHYTPIDGSHPSESATSQQLEQVPCAHAGFYFRAETIPTLALLEQAAAKGLRLVLTGHSLGGAVANMCTLTALQAQKKAREAAAVAAAGRRAASSEAAPAGSQAAAGCRPQQQQASTSSASMQDQQQQRKKNKVSPFAAAASASAVASAEAHTNHSWCSANSDILVSPQAALVEVLCVAFASPLWANQALTDYIDRNDWGELFVNVVVPEDYCLKLFNNVLTSANPAERHTLSRSNSTASLSQSSSNNRLEHDDVSTDPAAPFTVPDVPPDALEPAGLSKQLYSSSSDESSTTLTSSASSSSTVQTKRSFTPGSQQPLVSALAGTRRKQQKKKQLSFALPDQQDAVRNAGPTDTPAAAAVLTAGAGSELPVLEACRPPPVSVGPCSQPMNDLYGAADTGSWNDLAAALPSSPSCASLSSLSSLNSTRSWTLLAYLPDVLIRSFSSGSSSGLDDAGRLGARDSSDSGCPDETADAIAAMFAGAAAEPVGPNAAACAVAGPSGLEERRSSSSGGGFDSAVRCGLRHAKSSVDLSLNSLSDSSSSSISMDTSAMLASAVARRHHTPTGPAGTRLTKSQLKQNLQPLRPQQQQQQEAPLQQQQQQQQENCDGPVRVLRRSVTSASLSALALSSNKLRAPLKLSSSLAVATALLPSLRSVAHAGRAVLNTASSIKEAAFNVPLTVFEAGLIKALKPPMYKPVGQQWILSATGLVMQQQPITMYPKHVHDVFWHKELALVAFREHSIVFYKQRLLQQANRR